MARFHGVQLSPFVILVVLSSLPWRPGWAAQPRLQAPRPGTSCGPQGVYFLQHLLLHAVLRREQLLALLLQALPNDDGDGVLLGHVLQGCLRGPLPIRCGLPLPPAPGRLGTLLPPASSGVVSAPKVSSGPAPTGSPWGGCSSSAVPSGSSRSALCTTRVFSCVSVSCGTVKTCWYRT